jgi:hypothetical protein
MQCRQKTRPVLDFLEARLHPSGLVAIPVTAQVFVAATHSVTATQMTTVVTISTRTETPTQPGDPEPGCPTHPSGWIDPAPPDGDGTPPGDSPSIPGGPNAPRSV